MGERGMEFDWQEAEEQEVELFFELEYDRPEEGRLDNIPEERVCRYCHQVSDDNQEFCDQCGWWGWKSYELGFVTLANVFCEEFDQCQGDNFDVSQWQEPIARCGQCELLRLRVLAISDDIDQRFSQLAQENIPREERLEVVRQELVVFLERMEDARH